MEKKGSLRPLVADRVRKAVSQKWGPSFFNVFKERVV